MQVGRQRRGGGLWVFFLSGGVLSDIGRQDFHDRAVVFLGIFGNPFQGIDPAQPDCHFVISQLRNCFGKPVGDVALFHNPDSFLRHADIVLSCLNPPRSPIQPHQYEEGGDNLDDCDLSIECDLSKQPQYK